MTLFIDTSALYALLDVSAAASTTAWSTFEAARKRSEVLVTHNYVVSEACALVQRRLGAAAAVALLTQVLPVVTLSWVSTDVHDAAVTAFVAAPSRSVSLVDRVSFEVMRHEGIDTAFAFDADFARAGFRTVP